MSGAGRDTPQNDDGQTMLPQVSDPMLKPTSPAAVAAPGPDDDPPAQCSAFQGVRPAPVPHAPA